MDTKHINNEQLWRFFLAGVSNMSGASVTNPIDVIKIRMQLENELVKQKGLDVIRNRYYDGFLKGGLQIVRDEGVLGLYKGLLPSLMREGSYSTIRMGAYEPLKVLFGATDPAHTPLWKKICAGAISGTIGSSIATPTDLVKVRMQAQGKLVEGQVPRYRSTFAAFSEIFYTEGIRGLYVGIGPTVKRAAVLTATQIPSYDHAKHTILNAELMSEGPRLHVVCSMIAGFMTALTTSPVDVIKTRIMNQQRDHTKVYRNAFDCFWKTIRSEGFLGLYKGFFPNWMRIDENDNGPQFGRNIYHVRVLENVEVGTVIAQLSATDADSIHDNDIRYKILSTVPVDGIGMFTIDPVRGTVTTSAPLFSVTTRTFNITVQAYESKTEFTTTQLLVFVDAINLHQPIFQGTVNNTYYISVLEMVPVGTVVTRVHATDEDSSQNGEVHYYMVPPISPDLPFSISDDGTISTKATLDRKTMNVYQFRVGATDQGIPVRLHNTAIVRVRILDVNNNAPMFSKSTYSATLPTPTAAGQSVIRIHAMDFDSGQNAQIRYHVKDVSPTKCSGLFAIDALSGEIKTAKSSDAGHQMKCTLTVTASDDGIVRLVSETKVHINTVSKPSTDAIGNPFG
ncbi:hypothetical protein FSP39_011400 [Pinctada imbricata]|uniref:Cadherin domain-containing protein n=1 Tax=Pinctada imbricata TaxID=66713 RepID=A0AA88YMB4_PINIB|nr:hypothetical protein FSP39_011400 [Pinctada imbricata]